MGRNLQNMQEKLTENKMNVTSLFRDNTACVIKICDIIL